MKQQNVITGIGQLTEENRRIGNRLVVVSVCEVVWWCHMVLCFEMRTASSVQYTQCTVVLGCLAPIDFCAFTQSLEGVSRLNYWKGMKPRSKHV